MAVKSICKIDGCGKTSVARNLCNQHYRKWQRNGDPLGGRRPYGDAAKWIENILRVETDECIVWPFGKSGCGYGEIWSPVERRMIGAHVVICERLHGPRPSAHHQVAHSCGRGHLSCVTPSHLRWATYSENQIERADHGTSNRGTRHRSAKLTEAEVRTIRAAKGTVRRVVLAERFGVTPGNISNIMTGRLWYWLE